MIPLTRPIAGCVRFIDLHPKWRPPCAIRSISALRYQSCPKQVRPDLALFEWADEDALGATGQEPRQIGLAHRKRQLPHVVAVACEHVEGIELHLVIVLAGMQRVEV